MPPRGAASAAVAQPFTAVPVAADALAVAAAAGVRRRAPFSAVVAARPFFTLRPNIIAFLMNVPFSNRDVAAVAEPPTFSGREIKAGVLSIIISAAAFI